MIVCPCFSLPIVKHGYFAFWVCGTYAVIEVKLDELLQSRGRSRYWLAKETGLTPIAIANLCKGKTRGIDFATLNAICKALDCLANDVLAYVPDVELE
jgi:putative transcriptional regulator